MNAALPLVLFGLAGFSFGGVYALHTQGKSLWITGLVGVFGVLCVVAGWLYL